jgi:hypothetical protein
MAFSPPGFRPDDSIASPYFGGEGLILGYVDIFLRWGKIAAPKQMCCAIGQTGGQFFVSSVGRRATVHVWDEPCTFIVTDTSNCFHVQVRGVDLTFSRLI